MITLAEFLNFTTVIHRCGITPYTFKDGKMYLLLGRESKNGKKITDLGGGIKKKERVNTLSAGRREFTEESNGVLERFLRDLNELISIVDEDNNIAVVYLPVDVSVSDSIVEDFKKVSSNPREIYFDEISELIWVSIDELQQLFNDNQVYGVVRKFYKNNWEDTLPSLLKVKYDSFINT